MEYFTPNGRLGFQGGEPLGLIVGVKNIKMPLLLKASRKEEYV